MEPRTLFQFWDLVLILVQGAIAVAGFIGAMMIQRLIKAIDSLTLADAELHDRLTTYREDMLRNYVRNEQLEPIKKDIIGRVDKMEMSFKEALMMHEHREFQLYRAPLNHSRGIVNEGV